MALWKVKSNREKVVVLRETNRRVQFYSKTSNLSYYLIFHGRSQESLRVGIQPSRIRQDRLPAAQCRHFLCTKVHGRVSTVPATAKLSDEKIINYFCFCNNIDYSLMEKKYLIFDEDKIIFELFQQHISKMKPSRIKIVGYLDSEE